MPAGFIAETEFQALLAETLDQVLATQSDAPAVVAREMAMPGGGKIDILAVDADGIITVCECKLQRNAEIRREVVGQVLEYAGGLDKMPLREFRARVEARLERPLIEEMADRAGDDWDQGVWIDEVSRALELGNFRVIIAVDQIGSTLKQTVQYLNNHSNLAVLAVELQRQRLGEVEVLVPTVFAEEQARRKAPPAATSSTPEVADADTLIVAATHAWPEYERVGAYICQPFRSFRLNVEYLGFYAKRQIYSVFPKIVAFRQNIMFNEETVQELRGTSNAEDAQVAEIIERDLNAQAAAYNREGKAHQVVLLDAGAGFVLENPVRHDGRAAWLRGQRYTSSAALKTSPATTEELREAGG